VIPATAWTAKPIVHEITLAAQHWSSPDDWERDTQNGGVTIDRE
jgi:hypothetical protein